MTDADKPWAVRRPLLRVVRYRFRTTWHSRRGGYAALALLIALVGGLAMGSLAAARRTESSAASYFASVKPPDYTAITAVLNPLVGSNAGYDSALLRRISRLPHVGAVESASGVDVLPLGRDGSPENFAGFPPAAGNGLGSVDGLFFDQDRFSIVEGHRADPTRADQILMQVQVAQAAHLKVGDHITLGVYTNAQTELPGFGTSGVKPYSQVVVTLVGTFVEPQQIVQDDVDNSQSLALFTPAFTRPLLSCCANYTETAITAGGGTGHLAQVGTELLATLPKGFPTPIPTSTFVAKAERAIKPESIALGVFGGIAALAAVLVAGQIIGRQLRKGADELGTLRALGSGPAMTTADGLAGITGSVVVGAALALGVAAGLSPLAPLGPMRPVDPNPGVSFDWTVLGLGPVVLIVALTTLSMILAVRLAPRLARRHQRIGRAGSSLSRAAASSGVPAPAAVGIRFALDPGAGRNAVPVRSAILGAGLAVVVVVGTVTFGASLRSLVAHPALYGWNWDYVLSAGGGSGDIPEQQATRLLDRDPYVRAWSGVYFDDVAIDGHQVPVIGENPGTTVQPPVLSGHGLEASDEVVVGAITLAQLHKQVGDTVEVRAGSGSPTLLRIVGTASMPTIGGPGPHLEMGTGALVSSQVIPAAARNPFNDPVTGPETIFVDVRSGANPKAAMRSLQQAANALTNNFNFGVFVGTVLHPAEIVSYRSMSTTPAILGGALGAGAMSALGLTLVASVRLRRHDLAVLKTLGFTRGQLASVVAWQSSISVGMGTVVGVPLGIAVGRSLWDLFADDIHAVPAPSVPALWTAVIAVGALVLANVVAAVPGRMAARTSTAPLLRTE